MGIYLPNMEMPRGCASCKISRRNGKKMICPFIWKCEWDIHDPMSADHRLDGCPLVPVPEHGRLIDADALIEKVIAKYLEHERKGEFVFAAAEIKQDIVDLISNAPTIIEAEEGE